jgi:hypothetical protein
MLCGGDLSLRVSPGGARTICRACGWLSKPQIRREGDSVHMVHPIGANA